MKHRICGALIKFSMLGFAMLGTVSLWAHHSPTAEFDVSKTMTLTGTLTKVEWVNPHIVVYMEVSGGMWKLESNPPAWFRRVGVSKVDFSKAVGQTVTVEGNRAKDGSPYAYMHKITYQDGTSLELVNANGALPEK